MPKQRGLPPILEATADFEKWLAAQLPIVREDLALKHRHMAEGAFPFFRATFYRWLQAWPLVCEELAKARGCSRWETCMLRTSGRGATPKDGSSGESTTWMKYFQRRTRLTWYDWRRARIWRFWKTI